MTDKRNISAPSFQKGLQKKASRGNVLGDEFLFRPSISGENGTNQVCYWNFLFPDLEPDSAVTFDRYVGPSLESNWLLPGSIIVGAFPASEDDDETQQILESILLQGVTTFVCLQQEYRSSGVSEKMWRSGQALRPYFNDAVRIADEFQRTNTVSNLSMVSPDQLDFVHFPIVDCSISDDERVLCLARHLVRRVSNCEILYVHCWGGHGRSGTVVSIMLCLMYGLDAVQSMRRCQLCHDLRRCPVEVQSPQTPSQRQQVARIITRLLAAVPPQQSLPSPTDDPYISHDRLVDDNSQGSASLSPSSSNGSNSNSSKKKRDPPATPPTSMVIDTSRSTPNSSGDEGVTSQGVKRTIDDQTKKSSSPHHTNHPITVVNVSSSSSSSSTKRSTSVSPPRQPPSSTHETKIKVPVTTRQTPTVVGPSTSAAVNSTPAITSTTAVTGKGTGAKKLTVSTAKLMLLSSTSIDSSSDTPTSATAQSAHALSSPSTVVSPSFNNQPLTPVIVPPSRSSKTTTTTIAAAATNTTAVKAKDSRRMSLDFSVLSLSTPSALTGFGADKSNNSKKKKKNGGSGDANSDMLAAVTVTSVATGTSTAVLITNPLSLLSNEGTILKSSAPTPYMFDAQDEPPPTETIIIKGQTILASAGIFSRIGRKNVVLQGAIPLSSANAQQPLVGQEGKFQLENDDDANDLNANTNTVRTSFSASPRPSAQVLAAAVSTDMDQVDLGKKASGGMFSRVVTTLRGRKSKDK